MRTHVVARPLMGVALVLIVAGSGCQGQQKFGANMNRSTEALQAGDLQAARSHLDQAKPAAKSFEQRRLVRSMDGLICGAEFMMAGDIDQAVVAWSAIEDPQLSREVRVKARALLDVEVPMTPIEQGDKR